MRCVSIVLGLRKSRAATSRLVRPVATSLATWSSCGVSSSRVEVAAGRRRRLLGVITISGLRHGRSTWEIDVVNPAHGNRGLAQALLDGAPVDASAIPLVDDGAEALILDCMGYAPRHRKAIREAGITVPVLVSGSVLGAALGAAL